MPVIPTWVVKDWLVIAFCLAQSVSSSVYGKATVMSGELYSKMADHCTFVSRKPVYNTFLFCSPFILRRFAVRVSFFGESCCKTACDWLLFETNINTFFQKRWRLPLICGSSIVFWRMLSQNCVPFLLFHEIRFIDVRFGEHVSLNLFQDIWVRPISALRLAAGEVKQLSTVLYRELAKLYLRLQFRNLEIN